MLSKAAASGFAPTESAATSSSATQPPLDFAHASEWALATYLVRFHDAIELSVAELAPHHICEYVYALSERYARFYESCRIVDTADRVSTERRLVLCRATKLVMECCFDLLNIEPVSRL